MTTRLLERRIFFEIFVFWTDFPLIFMFFSEIYAFCFLSLFYNILFSIFLVFFLNFLYFFKIFCFYLWFFLFFKMILYTFLFFGLFAFFYFSAFFRSFSLFLINSNEKQISIFSSDLLGESSNLVDSITQLKKLCCSQ